MYEMMILILNERMERWRYHRFMPLCFFASQQLRDYERMGIIIMVKKSTMGL
jgi:hypothetical protein